MVSTIPFRELLSDMRIEMCSSTIVLGLSGLLGRFELFGGIYGSLSFRLLHRSFQPWVRENTDAKNDHKLTENRIKPYKNHTRGKKPHTKTRYSKFRSYFLLSSTVVFFFTDLVINLHQFEEPVLTHVDSFCHFAISSFLHFTISSYAISCF